MAAAAPVPSARPVARVARRRRRTVVINRSHSPSPVPDTDGEQKGSKARLQQTAVQTDAVDRSQSVFSNRDPDGARPAAVDGTGKGIVREALSVVHARLQTAKS